MTPFVFLVCELNADDTELRFTDFYGFLVYINLKICVNPLHLRHPRSITLRFFAKNLCESLR